MNYFTIQNKPGIISRVATAFGKHTVKAKKGTLDNWQVVQNRMDENSTSPEREHSNKKKRLKSSVHKLKWPKEEFNGSTSNARVVTLYDSPTRIAVREIHCFYKLVYLESFTDSIC